MARRTFNVVDVTEILIHWHAGRSINEVADSLGLDRKTVRKYVEPARQAGIAPGGPVMSSAEWARLVMAWFPQLADTRLNKVTWPEIAMFHDYIKAQLGCGVHQSTIHQRLRDEHGLNASYASVKRYVAANMPAETRRDQVVVLRGEVEPGSEAQIDYGQLGWFVDPRTGRRRKLWAFVMVLACSRHMFVQPTLVMDQQAWTKAHVDAFAFFGGVPARLVPDNLRTGVERTDLYDPKVNKSYAELAEHYGVLVDPARRAKPRDKARVERPMPYVRDSFWRGRDFASMTQIQAAALDWCLTVAGRRPSRALDGASPLSVFDAVEAAALGPLSARPFALASWSTATVGPDIHIKVGKTIYSVPWQHIGSRVDARTTDTMVQVFADGHLIATHTRKLTGKQTLDSHYPPEKIAFKVKTPAWCRDRADEIGPACAEVIDGLLELGALFRLRAAQGIIGLADKYTPARLEAACAKALAVGDPSYRTIKGILAVGAETDPVPAGRGDGGAGAFLHGPSQLFADVVPLPTANLTLGTDPATTTTVQAVRA